MRTKLRPLITELRPLITELRPLITELRPLITELRPLITELRPLITELRPFTTGFSLNSTVKTPFFHVQSTAFSSFIFLTLLYTFTCGLFGMVLLAS